MSKKQKGLGIPGIGPVKEKVLREAGYNTVEDLRNSDFFDIMKLPGFGYLTTCSLYLYIEKEIVYQPMIEIFDSKAEDVVVENKKIVPWEVYKKGKASGVQPSDFTLERTTVWSFPDRGDWASHTPQYRGNWSPRVVRNIIELYSKPGDLVLDPMVGGGTTPVECMLTGRNSISIDINQGAISITRNRLELPESMKKQLPKTSHRTFVGDVRNLDKIADESIDLIATHPPYANIIKYAPSVDGDLSQINDYDMFFSEFKKAIKEFHRVLKPGAYCSVLMGDTHSRSHFVPITARLMVDFLREGFVLKEDIIKKEWNCESDRNLGKYTNASFLLTMHEHLFVFRKLKKDEKMIMLKNSSIAFLE